MRKPSIILSVVLCLSLLSGCSVDITIRDENGSSIPLPDDVESAISELIPDKSTTSTTTTTTNGDFTESTTTGDDKPTDSTTTAGTTTSKPSTKKTDKTSNKTNPPSKNPSSSKSKSTTSSTKAVTTTKKDHGTPNINDTFHTDMADDVLVKLNAARKAEGLGELTMDRGNMMNAAKIRAKEITVKWAHERPDGDSWDTVFNEEGVKYNARGENLADGYTTADAVFQGWMNSPGHRANIMEPRFTHISIVCLEHEGHFYWVQLFGATIKR